MTYRFGYAPEGAYGHVVALVDQLADEPVDRLPEGLGDQVVEGAVDGPVLRRGLVLDLGCGYGAVAEPLAERGWRYLGLDIDAAAVADVRRRGFEGHVADLWTAGGEPLAARLAAVLAGRPVGLVLLLDVVEHCPAPTAFLAELAAALAGLGRPILLVSIPNVAHVDVAARLLGGRFGYTATGLLDRTHLQLWTGQRVRQDFADHGWLAVGANDVELRHSDQFDPDDPLQAEDSPLAAWIRLLRERADGFGYVYQFVRAFALAPPRTAPKAASGSLAPQPSGSPPAGAAPAVRPFLSVVVRTRGDRLRGLREALLCLAAQNDPDFDVELVVHDGDGGRLAAVRSLVREFEPALAARTQVRACVDGGRARPLNVGLEAAHGRYIAFLDDDDLVTADWVAAFHAAADAWPGRIVRSLSVQQDVARTGPPPWSPYEARSTFRAPYREAFDLVDHLVANQTPIHTFAVPRGLVCGLGLRFDESLTVMEDWDFLLRAAQVADVHDTSLVTGIYHWWLDGSGSAGAATREVWEATRRLILERLTERPVLLPASAARRLVGWTEERLTERALRELAEARAAIAAASLDAVERSRSWRMTAPLRALSAATRRAGRRAAPVVRRAGRAAARRA